MLLSSGALFLSPVLPSIDSFSAFTPCQLPISHPSSIDTSFLQVLFPQPILNHPLVAIILIPILLHISPFSSLPDSISSHPFPFLSPSIIIRTSIYPHSLSPTNPFPLHYFFFPTMHSFHYCSALFPFPLCSCSNLVSFTFHPFLIR